MNYFLNYREGHIKNSLSVCLCLHWGHENNDWDFGASPIKLSSIIRENSERVLTNLHSVYWWK